MPKWAGKWKGGRFYLDGDRKPVFFIERRVAGKVRPIKLKTQDPDLALGELATFARDPVAYVRQLDAPPPVDLDPVLITKERIRLHLAAIHDRTADYRAARAKYLNDWAEQGVDLRSPDRKALRRALASFDGGHKGRTEHLNAFANWLVREGELTSWTPLVNTRPTVPTRADRRAYSLEELRETYERLVKTNGAPVQDCFRVRAATGLHHTEVERLQGCEVYTGPLPDKGDAIRVLPEESKEIRGVLQVMHKSRHRHRQSVDGPTLEAALRLREHVPDRMTMWYAMDPLVPSNLRHTFVTLAGEVGELVRYQQVGLDRARIAQAVGHRAGSTMTADRYDKLQVPPMVRLPLGF